MNSEQLLNDLKKKVEVQRIPKALWLCLNHTDHNKEDIIKVGAAWIDDNNLILNTKIFSNFIKRQIHTVNRNLREHGFKTKKIRHAERVQYFSKLNISPPVVKSWCLRNHKDFTRYSDEKIIDQIPYKAIPKKSERIQMIFSQMSPKYISYNNITGLKDRNDTQILTNTKTSCMNQHSLNSNLSNDLDEFSTDNYDSLDSSFSDHDQYFA